MLKMLHVMSYKTCKFGYKHNHRCVSLSKFHSLSGGSEHSDNKGSGSFDVSAFSFADSGSHSGSGAGSNSGLFGHSDQDSDHTDNSLLNDGSISDKHSGNSDSLGDSHSDGKTHIYTEI